MLLCDEGRKQHLANMLIAFQPVEGGYGLIARCAEHGELFLTMGRIGGLRMAVHQPMAVASLLLQIEDDYEDDNEDDDQ